MTDKQKRNSLIKQDPTTLTDTKDPQIIENVADILKLLSNPQRLAICCYLAQEELTVTELTKRVGLSQSALSQQLKRLKTKKIITFRREHNKLYYTLISENIQKIIQLLITLYCPPAQK